jgi:predicted cupin superfamily sugar epimerase
MLIAQSEQKPTLSLTLKYFNDNNKTHHLLVQAKSKINDKFQQIEGAPVQFYITSDDNKQNLLGKAVTDDKGEAILVIPAAAKKEWLKSPNQNFVVVSTVSNMFEESRAELAITKAKLQIDTAEGKMITAKIVALVDTAWVPIANVDFVLGVKRLGGILNANETLTYTSDSTGLVTAEFKRDSLPGDKNGNLVLIASVIDNDTYGNLTAEMVVPWGAKTVYTTNFDHRSLFARRGYSPIWLELLAYTIVAAVWFVIIYLLMLIRKIKKLGAE